MSDQISTPAAPPAAGATAESVTDADVSALGAGAAARVLKAMPADVRSSFSAVQRHALGEALATAKGGRFFVNLRFSLLGLFVNFIVGKERRSAARRQVEREKHPVLTPGNFLIMCLSWPVGILLGWATYLMIYGVL